MTNSGRVIEQIRNDRQGSIRELACLCFFNKLIFNYDKKIARKVLQIVKLIVSLFVMKSKHASLLKLARVCIDSFAL